MIAAPGAVVEVSLLAAGVLPCLALLLAPLIVCAALQGHFRTAARGALAGALLLLLGGMAASVAGAAVSYSLAGF